MANVIDSEGFGISTNVNDYVTYANWIVYGGSCTIQTGGDFGDNFLGIGEEAVIARLLPITPATQFTAAMRLGGNGIYGPNTGPDAYIHFCDPTGKIQLSIVINPGQINGVINVYTGSAEQSSDDSQTLGALLATSPAGTWPTGGTALLEVAVVVGVTTGSVAVRVNTQPIASLSVTDQDTDPTIAGTVQMLTLYAHTGNFSFQCWTLTDTFEAYLGNRRVQTLYTVSAGSSTQFTPVGHSDNWQNTATVPPNPSSDYNEATTVDYVDNFGISTLDTTFSDIAAVNIKGIYYQTLSGTRQMGQLCISSGTTSESASIFLSDSARQVTQPVTDDPATGVSWTTGGVQAMTPGYKLTV
jgi:hypothetical protein